MEELRLNALQRGIAPSRIVFSAQVPWLIHTEVKTVADLVLDTTLKNGHTSTADALWAGRGRCKGLLCDATTASAG